MLCKFSIAIQYDQFLNYYKFSIIPLFVNADIAIIERIMENLIDNAVCHTSKSGSVRLIFSVKNGDIAVCVSDNGCGIPNEDSYF